MDALVAQAHATVAQSHQAGVMGRPPIELLNKVIDRLVCSSSNALDDPPQVFLDLVLTMGQQLLSHDSLIQVLPHLIDLEFRCWEACAHALAHTSECRAAAHAYGALRISRRRWMRCSNESPAWTAVSRSTQCRHFNYYGTYNNIY